ncbi:hypothetical protein HDZ31DRAFT_75848 [Schizophyllum fasciatum]
MLRVAGVAFGRTASIGPFGVRWYMDDMRTWGPSPVRRHGPMGQAVVPPACLQGEKCTGFQHLRSQIVPLSSPSSSLTIVFPHHSIRFVTFGTGLVRDMLRVAGVAFGCTASIGPFGLRWYMDDIRTWGPSPVRRHGPTISRGAPGMSARGIVLEFTSPPFKFHSTWNARVPQGSKFPAMITVSEAEKQALLHAAGAVKRAAPSPPTTPSCRHWDKRRQLDCTVPAAALTMSETHVQLQTAESSLEPVQAAVGERLEWFFQGCGVLFKRRSPLHYVERGRHPVIVQRTTATVKGQNEPDIALRGSLALEAALTRASLALEYPFQSSIREFVVNKLSSAEIIGLEARSHAHVVCEDADPATALYALIDAIALEPLGGSILDQWVANNFAPIMQDVVHIPSIWTAYTAALKQGHAELTVAVAPRQDRRRSVTDRQAAPHSLSADLHEQSDDHIMVISDRSSARGDDATVRASYRKLPRQRGKYAKQHHGGKMVTQIVLPGNIKRVPKLVDPATHENIPPRTAFSAASPPAAHQDRDSVCLGKRKAPPEDPTTVSARNPTVYGSLLDSNLRFACLHLRAQWAVAQLTREYRYALLVTWCLLMRLARDVTPCHELVGVLTAARG